MHIQAIVGRFSRLRPRFAAALAFGIPTAALIHFAWYPDARWSGIAPALTIGAGLAHALAGAITGPRLVDLSRTSRSAALLGAGTSLLALAFFAPALAVYIIVHDGLQSSVLGYAIFTFFTGLFAFLGAGWALLLLSVGVGMALNRIGSIATSA